MSPVHLQWHRQEQQLPQQRPMSQQPHRRKATFSSTWSIVMEDMPSSRVSSQSRKIFNEFSPLRTEENNGLFFSLFFYYSYYLKGFFFYAESLIVDINRYTCEESNRTKYFCSHTCLWTRMNDFLLRKTWEQKKKGKRKQDQEIWTNKRWKKD